VPTVFRYDRRPLSTRRSGSFAQSDCLGLGDLTYADHLAQVSLDEVNHIHGHRFHHDLNMEIGGGSVRPYAIRDQVAFGEGLKQTGQQAGGWVGIKHEVYGDRSREGVGRGDGHDENSGSAAKKRSRTPAAWQPGH
jgi:hypothetical protein